MKTDLTVFDVRRATNWENWDKDSNLGRSTWRGENPPNGALINYWLKSAGPVTVTIADACVIATRNNARLSSSLRTG